jgi:predicted component of type VI protein secretion system
MNEEPDIERIKKEILERAIYRYEMRIADLRSQLDQTVLHARV